jgi:hypothetical protein
MNFAAGLRSSSDLVDEAVPKAARSPLPKSRYFSLAPSIGVARSEAKPSAYAGVGCRHFARHLRRVTRRSIWAITGRVDRASALAALPIDHVCKGVGREKHGEIVGYILALRRDLDAISLSRRRKCADHRRSGQA